MKRRLKDIYGWLWWYHFSKAPMKRRLKVEGNQYSRSQRGLAPMKRRLKVPFLTAKARAPPIGSDEKEIESMHMERP